MATLHDLQWEIQNQLHQLTRAANRDLLHKLAALCQEEEVEDVPGEDATEVELFDFIVDFLRSKRLKSLEDQGMSRLLAFRDLIDDLQAPQRHTLLNRKPVAPLVIILGRQHYYMKEVKCRQWSTYKLQGHKQLSHRVHLHFILSMSLESDPH
ncbi:uncharacterized protein LOC143413911 [Maylandia zebra]|uniref:uncharacterized protein LOC143413911 n=1 Tax=Maylandia zebra TaxID=106582 RepID=UPI00403D455E